MAIHGKISASLAGSATIFASIASAGVNLPIIWRTVKHKAVVKKITLATACIVIIGIIAVIADRFFQISETLLHKFF